MRTTLWCRVIGCLIYTGLFPQKSPVISGSFVALLREMTCGLRHPMSLRHPESCALSPSVVCLCFAPCRELSAESRVCVLLSVESRVCVHVEEQI